MLGSARRVKTNSLETFSYGLPYKKTPKSYHIWGDTGCSLEDLSDMMDDLMMIMIFVVQSISFQTFFFVQAFKIIVDSWKFSMLLLYILWNDRPIFMISCSNEHLQQELEYTLLKPYSYNWWLSKMQSGREDTLQKRYAIKLF